MELLVSPGLFSRVGADLASLGVVGEQTNLVVAYLATISRKAERPFGVVVQSSSAAGKSTLAGAVAAFVPEEDLGATGGKPPLLPPPREVVWSQLSLRTWWRSSVRWPRWRCLQSGLGPLARHDEQDDQECADYAQAGTCPCPPAPATATVTFWVLLTSLKTVSTRTGRRPGSLSLLAATSWKGASTSWPGSATTPPTSG
jgi:hypothetical protein